jgi:hypothetical protein
MIALARARIFFRRQKVNLYEAFRWGGIRLRGGFYVEMHS